MGEEDDGRPQVGASDLDADLLSLRDQIAEARAEDLPPLVEQMTRLAALKARLGGGTSLPVDVASPYFAHMRLQGGGTRDVHDRQARLHRSPSNVQIVDWRNAPVSRIYYRYEEGDDYEEEIAGQRVEGVVEARRNLSIARGNLRRSARRRARSSRTRAATGSQAVGQIAPVLHGGMGKAARPVARAGRKGQARHPSRHRARRQGAARDRRAHRQGAVRADHAAGQRHGRDPGRRGLRQDHGRAPPHRVPRTSRTAARFQPQNTLFVVPSQALVRYVAGVLPALGVSGVPVVTYTRLGAHDAHALPARGADEVQRRAARAGLAREEAPGDARDARALGRRAGRSDRARARGDLDAPAVEAWNRDGKRALVPRLSALSAGSKKSRARCQRARRARGLREALEEARRRLRARLGRAAHRSGDARRGLRGHRRHASATSSALSRGCKRQLAKPQEAPVDEEGKPMLDSEGLPVGRDEDDPAGKFDDEDDPILLRLCQLKRGGLMPPGGDEMIYEHVAIDEAQDRSALEVKVLVEAVRAPDDDPAKRSVTIAGDTAQRLVFDNNFSRLGGAAPADRPAARSCGRSSCRTARPPRSCCSRARSSARARARRAARRAPRRAGRAPRVRRYRRGGRVPRRRAAQPDGARADRVVRGDLAPRRAGRRVLRRPPARRGPGAAPRAPRRVQLPARRRRHRRRAGQGPRVRLRRDGRRQRRELPRPSTGRATCCTSA